MIQPFQPEISHNGHEHSDGFEHVRKAPLAAGRSHRRTQQIVKPENVHDIEILKPRQALGKRAHLHRGAAEFEKGSVRFRDVQDSHWSRRIFFSDLAKTLKRNSCSARCCPRAPISFAWTGSASSASIEVASWIGSPCGTR